METDFIKKNCVFVSMCKICERMCFFIFMWIIQLLEAIWFCSQYLCSTTNYVFDFNTISLYEIDNTDFYSFRIHCMCLLYRHTEYHTRTDRHTQVVELKFCTTQRHKYRGHPMRIEMYIYNHFYMNWNSYKKLLFVSHY